MALNAELHCTLPAVFLNKSPYLSDHVEVFTDVMQQKRSILRIISCISKLVCTKTAWSHRKASSYDTTSQSLHVASQGFAKHLLLGQTHFTNTSKHCSFQPVKESSGTCFGASDCVWLAGLDFHAMLTLCHWASNPTDHGSTPFSSHLAASVIRCRAWM